MKASIFSIFLLSLISTSYSLASAIKYPSAYLYCPNWRNIPSKAVIVLDNKSYALKIEDGNSAKLTEAYNFLSKMQSVACGAKTIGAVSSKFSVVGRFQMLSGSYVFVAQEILK